MCGFTSYLVSFEKDRAAPGLYKSDHGMNQGGFPYPISAENRYDISFGYVEGNSLEDITVLIVGMEIRNNKHHGLPD